MKSKLPDSAAIGRGKALAEMVRLPADGWSSETRRYVAGEILGPLREARRRRWQRIKHKPSAKIDAVNALLVVHAADTTIIGKLWRARKHGATKKLVNLINEATTSLDDAARNAVCAALDTAERVNQALVTLMGEQEQLLFYIRAALARALEEVEREMNHRHLGDANAPHLAWAPVESLKARARHMGEAVQSEWSTWPPSSELTGQKRLLGSVAIHARRLATAFRALRPDHRASLAKLLREALPDGDSFALLFDEHSRPIAPLTATLREISGDAELTLPFTVPKRLFSPVAIHAVKLAEAIDALHFRYRERLLRLGRERSPDRPATAETAHTAAMLMSQLGVLAASAKSLRRLFRAPRGRQLNRVRGKFVQQMRSAFETYTGTPARKASNRSPGYFETFLGAVMPEWLHRDALGVEYAADPRRKKKRKTSS